MLNDDCVVFDSLTGKCYPTLFDLEQVYWTAMYEDHGSPPDPPDPDENKPAPFVPTPMAFKVTEMDMDSLLEDIIPVWTQRVDGVWIVGVNVMPTPANIAAIMGDDLF
mgnify:CR=1 FL=1